MGNSWDEERILDTEKSEAESHGEIAVRKMRETSRRRRRGERVALENSQDTSQARCGFRSRALPRHPQESNPEVIREVSVGHSEKRRPLSARGRYALYAEIPRGRRRRGRRRGKRRGERERAEER